MNWISIIFGIFRHCGEWNIQNFLPSMTVFCNYLKGKNESTIWHCLEELFLLKVEINRGKIEDRQKMWGMSLKILPVVNDSNNVNGIYTPILKMFS